MLRRFQSAPTAWWAWACTAILMSGAATLLEYCQKALDNDNDGNGSDDITVWKRQ